MSSSHPFTEQESKEEGNNMKIVTHGVWSDKEMILVAEASKHEEVAEKNSFDQANADRLAKVLAGMPMAPKDPPPTRGVLARKTS